jgi:hypothetical protein
LKRRRFGTNREVAQAMRALELALQFALNDGVRASFALELGNWRGDRGP